MRTTKTKLAMKRNLASVASRKRGLLGSMILIALLLIITSVMSLGVDYAHLAASRTQIRNAADAAALGGAMQLYKDPSTCEAYAKTLAEHNIADGIKLKNFSDQVIVTATTQAPTTTDLGKVTVTIDVLLDDLISPIFGRFSDRIHCVSVAGGTGTVVRSFEDVLFPLAVSIDFKPSGVKGEPSTGSLADAINGSKLLTIYINSQKYKNGAWTSFSTKNTNANWITDAIAKCLGIQSSKYSDVIIPSVHIGVDDIFLNNGVAGQKDLADDPFYSKLTDGRTLILPVISGDPALNQSRLCIGMVAVKVLAVTKNDKNGVVETLVVQIMDTAIPGIAGTITATGNPQWDTALGEATPAVVKLLQ